jgi:hypothetical protein
MCVTGHALLAALVRRIGNEAYCPTVAELAALLPAGCCFDDVERALAGGQGEAFAAARRRLELVRPAAAR